MLPTVVGRITQRDPDVGPPRMCPSIRAQPIPSFTTQVAIVFGVAYEVSQNASPRPRRAPPSGFSSNHLTPISISALRYSQPCSVVLSRASHTNVQVVSLKSASAASPNLFLAIRYCAALILSSALICRAKLDGLNLAYSLQAIRYPGRVDVRELPKLATVLLGLPNVGPTCQVPITFIQPC